MNKLICDIITVILTPTDSSSLARAEAQLFELYRTQPDPTLNFYLDTLQLTNSPNQSLNSEEQLISHNVYQFIALQLKFCLSSNPIPPYQPLWHRLSIETQHRFKIQLFQLLVAQIDQKIASYIAEVVGNLAANLIIEDDVSWPQFKCVMVEMIRNQGELGIRFGFSILQHFFSNQLQNFKHIIPTLMPKLFDLGFQNHHIHVRYAASRSLNAYLLVLNHQRHKDFHHLIPDLISVAQNLLEEGSDEGLAVLAEAMENEPRFFKPYFGQIVQFFTKLNDGTYLEATKQTATMSLVNYCQIYPSLFKPPAIDLLVDMVILRMLSRPLEITEVWMCPEQGFDAHHAHDPFQQAIENNLCLLERVISNVDQKLALAKIIKNIRQLLNQSQDADKCRYVALLILSQLGVYVDSIENLNDELKLTFEYLCDDNPKIRYAAAHVIGLLSTECKLQINSSKYASYFLEQLWTALLRQPCPRVISHILGALNNLLEKLSPFYVEQYFDHLFACFMDYLINGISIVKQSVLMALSSLAECCKPQFAEKLPLIFKTVSPYFQEKDYLHPCYNKLRGHALQCLSLLAVILQRENFIDHLQYLVELLFYVTSEHFSQYIPSKRFLIESWSRLAFQFEIELSKCLERYMLPMLEAVASAVIAAKEIYQRQTAHSHPDQQSGEILILIQEAELGIRMINNFVSKVQGVAETYHEEIYAIYVNVVQYLPDEDLKRKVYKAWPSLIRGMRPKQLREQAVQPTVQLLTDLLSRKNQPTLLPTKLHCMAKILYRFSAKLLTPELLLILTHKLLSTLNYCEDRKANIMRRAVDYDHDEMQIAITQIQDQQDIQQAASEVIAEVFRIYKRDFAEFGRVIVREFLSELFVAGMKERTVRIGLSIIEDLIQYLGYQQLSGCWQLFQKMIEWSICLTESHVRQIAASALGVFAEHMPYELRNQQTAMSWLKLLKNVYEIESKQEKKERVVLCLQNILAAMGKIMHSYSQWIDITVYLDFWLSQLPLKYDQPQRDTITKILMYLVQQHGELMYDSKLEWTLQIMRVIGGSIGFQKEEGLMRLRNCMNRIMTGRLFQMHQDELHQYIESEVLQALQGLMMNAGEEQA